MCRNDIFLGILMQVTANCLLLCGFLFIVLTILVDNLKRHMCSIQARKIYFG